MHKVAMHGRRIDKDAVNYVSEIIEIIKHYDREIYVSPDLAALTNVSELLEGFPQYNPEEELQEFEAVFSLGGDGTLLDTLTHVGKSGVPILGVNLGRLGFLAVISRENIKEALSSFFNGRYSLDKRTLLQLESPVPMFEGKNYALNEFAILRKDTSSMIVVETFLDGEFLNTYWADGLMIATPTGSTGYSLSCGGPIIMPDTSNFIITPISPHNLNVRPLIISENSELLIKVTLPNQSYQISLDSRSEALEEQIKLSIRKAPFHANLVKVEGISFLDTLRNKLSWGLDKRN